MQRVSAVTAMAVGAVLVVGGPAMAATRAEAVPAAAVSADAASSGTIDVISGTLGIAQQIWDIAEAAVITDQNRTGLVRSLQEAGWYKFDGKYNVAVMVAPGGSTQGRFTTDLDGKVTDAVYHYKDYPPFRLVVFKSGTVKNNGDGGYINWAYKGWFTRTGMTVKFHKP